MPFTKRNLELDERRAIRDRLEWFHQQHYRNRQAMNLDADVAPSTASGWFHPEPSVPDTVSLVRIAERKNLNLNWLLLGEGEPLRGVEPDADAWTRLRQTLVAELISHGATAPDAEACVPATDRLFHSLMIEVLETWMRRVQPPVARRGNGIGHALGRVVAGLPPFPAPRLPRSLRRLIGS